MECGLKSFLYPIDPTEAQHQKAASEFKVNHDSGGAEGLHVYRNLSGFLRVI